MLRSPFAYPRSLFLVIALVCFGALAVAVFYFQNTVGLEPCPMCIVQRYAIIGVGAFCVFAACCRGRGWRAVWGVLAIALAGGGAFTAARQSWLQWHPPEFATCGRDFYGMVESFPLERAIPMIFRGGGDCSKVDWTFLRGSLANWSFVWFVIAIVVILALLLWGGRQTGTSLGG